MTRRGRRESGTAATNSRRKPDSRPQISTSVLPAPTAPSAATFAEIAPAPPNPAAGFAPFCCLLLVGIGLGAGLRELSAAWSDHCEDEALRTRLVGTSLLLGGLPAIWLPRVLLSRFARNAERPATPETRRRRASFGATLNAAAFLAAALAWALVPRLTLWLESWRAGVVEQLVTSPSLLRAAAIAPLLLATALLIALSVLLLFTWRGWIRSLWDESPATPIGLACGLLGAALVGLRPSSSGAGDAGYFLSIGAWCGAAALAVFAMPSASRPTRSVPQVSASIGAAELVALVVLTAVSAALAFRVGLSELMNGASAGAALWLPLAAATGLVASALAGAALGGSRAAALWPIAWQVAFGVALVGVDSRTQAATVLTMLACGAAVAAAQRVSGFAHAVGNAPLSVLSAFVGGLGIAWLSQSAARPSRAEGGADRAAGIAPVAVEIARLFAREPDATPASPDENAIPRARSIAEPDLADGRFDAILLAPTDPDPIENAPRLPGLHESARAARTLRRTWSTIRNGGRIGLVLPADEWVDAFFQTAARRRRREPALACYAVHFPGSTQDGGSLVLMAGSDVPQWLRARLPDVQPSLFPVVSGSQIRTLIRELRGRESK